jgi:hypothetical protein
LDRAAGLFGAAGIPLLGADAFFLKTGELLEEAADSYKPILSDETRGLEVI